MSGTNAVKDESERNEVERLQPVVMCCSCLGDGKETCHNPDHGFINAMMWHDIGRLGCPVCGHDERHKVKNGGDCDLCMGSGMTSEYDGRKFCEEMGYDYDDIQDAYGT